MSRVHDLESEVAALKSQLQQMSAVQNQLKSQFAGHVHKVPEEHWGKAGVGSLQDCATCVVAFQAPSTLKSINVTSGPPEPPN